MLKLIGRVLRSIPIWGQLILALFCLGVIFLCSERGNKLKDDNVFEEIVEDVVQENTGLDIDLTPNSKEVVT